MWPLVVRCVPLWSHLLLCSPVCTGVSYVVLCDFMCSFVVPVGPMWSYVALFGLVYSSVALCGRELSSVVLCECMRFYKVLYSPM